MTFSAVRGREGIKGFFTTVTTAMPDFRFTRGLLRDGGPRGVAGDGERDVAGRLRPVSGHGQGGEGAHHRDFPRGGRQIQEVWVYLDALRILEQFGVLPPPAA